MRLLHINDWVEKGVWEEYGKLIATLSFLEWFLEEAIILLILKRQYDPQQKVDLVLSKQISGSRFSYKINLIGEFELLSKPLKEKLDDIRRRRNIFIHGIGIKESDKVFLQARNGNKELFNEANIKEFKKFVEETGGGLVEEFEQAGFRLQAPSQAPKVYIGGGN